MGNNPTVEQLPFIPLHDDITLEEFLSLEPLLWVPEFRQLNYVTQEGIKKSQEPTGSDGEYTRRDIMAFFFNANLPGIYDLGLQQVAVTGDRDGGATYLLSDALRAVNFFIASVINPEETCSNLDEANLELDCLNPWGVCAKVDDERAAYLYGKHRDNLALNWLILDETRKLKPLRPWLKLPAWTLKQFCFLLEGEDPSDKTHRLKNGRKELMVQAVDSYQIPYAPTTRDGYDPTGIYQAIRCKYKSADLVRVARDIGIKVPYYMLPMLEVDKTQPEPDSYPSLSASTKHKSGFLDEVQKAIDRVKADKDQPPDGTAAGARANGAHEVAAMDVPIEFSDSNHEFHATELAIAIASWQDLFINGEYDPNDSRNDSDQIKDWLRGKHPSLGSNAVDAIARIIKPDKMTGSRKR